MVIHRGERMNALTHLIGASLGLVGAAILVVQASRQGDPWKIVSFSIYGLTLVALYVFSTLYHMAWGKAKTIFQTLDHAAIYLLIAGTYTPFTLITLRGSWGWSLFGMVWGLGLFGMLQDVLSKRRRSILSVIIYLLMGWMVVIAIRPLMRVLPFAGMLLLVAGGVSYSIGVVFYALDKRLAYSHEIFHLFVLAGSTCHYLSILLYVA